MKVTKNVAPKSAKSKTVRSESKSPEGIEVVNFATVPETEAPAPKAKATKPVAKAKASPEVRAAKAILRASTLKEVPSVIRMSLLGDTKEPSEDSVADLIAQAKKLGFDLVHCNWAKAAKAVKANDLKSLKA